MPLPGEAKFSAPGLGLGGVDRIGQRLVRRVGAGHHHQRRVGEQHDRRQVLLRVVRHLRVQRRVDRQVAGLAEHDRVAVGRRLGDRVDAEVAAGAGLVVDDEGPAGGRGDLLAGLAGNDVGAAAGRERHDDADRLGRPGLREGARAERRWRRAASRRRREACMLSPVVDRLTPAVDAAASVVGLQYWRCDRTTVQSIVSCESINGTFAMDLRDLRYFETIAELQHVGRASAQAAPHAAGADELRAAARGGLRRRAVREGRPRHPAHRGRARCC